MEIRRPPWINVAIIDRLASSSLVVAGGERERNRPSAEDLEDEEGIGRWRAGGGGGVRRVEVVVEDEEGEETTGRGGRPRSKVSVERLETIWRWKADE